MTIAGKELAVRVWPIRDAAAVRVFSFRRTAASAAVKGEGRRWGYR